MATKLEKIIEAVHATTGELREVVTKLEKSLDNQTRAGLRELAYQAKNEITEKLLKLVSKLNEGGLQ